MTNETGEPSTPWQRLPDIPVGKWEPASLVVNDKLYVAGGWDRRIAEDKTWPSSPEVGHRRSEVG